MNPIRWTLLLLSIPALHSSAQATVNDHYTMQVDSVQSMVIYGLDTNLGPCTLSTGTSGHLSGDMVVVLHPGAFPISDGQLDGGHCGCQPDLVGIIPNSLPGLPPLLEVHLSSLVVKPVSTPFSCDSTGLFLTNVTCEVTSGTLDVSNGYRCATGQLLRFGTLHVGSGGSALCNYNLQAPPLAGNLVAGTRWNFQFAYRDSAAGGAKFNASDAIAIDFVP